MSKPASGRVVLVGKGAAGWTDSAGVKFQGEKNRTEATSLQAVLITAARQANEKRVDGSPSYCATSKTGDQVSRQHMSGVRVCPENFGIVEN